MNIIQLPSFQIATIAKGDPNSDRVAILIPGRLDTKDYINFTKHMEFLASRGFYTVTFDYPGTWDSPGNVEYTTTNYMKVVNEFIEFLGNRPTLLFGHSRGGQVAMLIGCSNQYITGFAVVNASFGPPSPPDSTKVENGYLPEYRDLPPGDTRTQQQVKFHLSLNYWEDGMQYDCVPELRNCTKPKLIIHGTQDEFQSLEEVKNIYAEIHEPKMFKTIQSDHDYRLHADVIDEVNVALGEFIETHL